MALSFNVILKPELTVVIEGEEHKLDVVPKRSSKVVTSEKKKLLGAVKLQELVTDLDQVGRFIHIAYNGVVAAGPKFTGIQIEIQRMGYDVTRVCDKSALTVAKFKKSSATVLNCLEATYGYLIDHMEKMAVVTLTSVSELAGQMAEAAMELRQDFETEQQKAIKILEKLQKAKGDEAKRIEKKKKEQEQFLREHERQRQLMEELQRLKHNAEAERREIEQNEDAFIGSIGHVRLIINAFTSSLRVELDEHEVKKQAAHWEEKIEALKEENEIHQRQYEALAKMTEIAARMKECKTEQNMPEVAENALHGAVGALKQLVEIMMQAAQFWKQMEEHCKSLVEEGVKRQIEEALKLDESMRMKIWTSKPFKTEAIRFYAGWVALESMCAEYMEQIKPTQEGMHQYLLENPTYEDSPQSTVKLTRDSNSLGE